MAFLVFFSIGFGGLFVGSMFSHVKHSFGSGFVSILLLFISILGKAKSAWASSVGGVVGAGVLIFRLDLADFLSRRRLAFSFSSSSVSSICFTCKKKTDIFQRVRGG